MNQTNMNQTMENQSQRPNTTRITNAVFGLVGPERILARNLNSPVRYHIQRRYPREDIQES